MEKLRWAEPKVKYHKKVVKNYKKIQFCKNPIFKKTTPFWKLPPRSIYRSPHQEIESLWGAACYCYRWFMILRWIFYVQFVYNTLWRCSIQTELNFNNLNLSPRAHLTSQRKWSIYFVQIYWRQCEVFVHILTNRLLI